MASEQPLAKKLLIKPGNTIAPINAPRNYKTLLGPLPEGAEIVVRAPGDGASLVHLFVTTMAELQTQLPRAKQAMAKDGGTPAALVESLGLRQVSDEATLAPAVEEVIAANAAKADEYRAGKTGLMGFFVGQVMRKTGGKANPELVNRLVAERLGAS